MQRLASRFVPIARDTPVPPDMCDYLKEGPLVHGVLDGISLLDLRPQT